MKTTVKIIVIDCGFVLRQVRDRQGLRVNGVAPPDEPLESFKPSRSLKELGYVKNLFVVFSSHGSALSLWNVTNCHVNTCFEKLCDFLLNKNKTIPLRDVHVLLKIQCNTV